MKFIKNIIKNIKKTFSSEKNDSNSLNSTQSSEHAEKNAARRQSPHYPSSKRPQGKHKKPRAEKPRWDINQFAVEPMEGKTRFHDFDLPLPIMHAIFDLGFSYCTPIQANVLHHTLTGQDAIGQAQTGTGKTAAFLLTVLTQFNRNRQKSPVLGQPRALVLAPTRELVLQIAKDANKLTAYLPTKTITLVGGMSFENQLKQLKQAPVDLIIATPGRLIDFLNRQIVNLSSIEILVIDEADRMLSMGFIPDVKKIVRATPAKEQRQTLLFSATFNQDVLNLASSWTVDPASVVIEPEQVAVDSVQQLLYTVSSHEKVTLLYNFIELDDIARVIVFANRRDTAREVCHRLKQQKINVDLLSGEISQSQRIRTLDAFKAGKTRVLVATDVAGRGIHVDGVTHVFNYDLPEDPEDYVHRIGRTGRAGEVGISISFAGEDDVFQIPEIEKLMGYKLECLQPLPDYLTPLPYRSTKLARSRSNDHNSKPRNARRPSPSRSSPR